LLGWLFYAAAFAAVLLALRVMGFPILRFIGE